MLANARIVLRVVVRTDAATTSALRDTGTLRNTGTSRSTSTLESTGTLRSTSTLRCNGSLRNTSTLRSGVVVIHVVMVVLSIGGTGLLSLLSLMHKSVNLAPPRINESLTLLLNKGIVSNNSKKRGICRVS